MSTNVAEREIDEVLDARREDERRQERERVRRDLEAKKARTAAEEKQAARKRRADEAEQRELAHAPVVKVIYKGITVSIKMAGALDPTVALTCEEGAKRAVRILANAHKQAVGAARSRALGGLERDEDLVRLVLRLEDELRAAAKLGAVNIDHKAV